MFDRRNKRNVRDKSLFEPETNLPFYDASSDNGYTLEERERGRLKFYQQLGSENIASQAHVDHVSYNYAYISHGTLHICGHFE